jgi:hypothetical protein
VENIGNVDCLSLEASAISKRNTHDAHHWVTLQGKRFRHVCIDVALLGRRSPCDGECRMDSTPLTALGSQMLLRCAEDMSERFMRSCNCYSK